MRSCRLTLSKRRESLHHALLKMIDEMGIRWPTLVPENIMLVEFMLVSYALLRELIVSPADEVILGYFV